MPSHIIQQRCGTISGLADALDHLPARGMIRTTKKEVVRVSVLSSTWLAGTRTRATLLTLLAVIAPALYALVEWGRNNFLRLVHVFPGPFKPSDYDWGLAGLMTNPEWSLPGRLANALFDLLAFATEAALIGTLFAFFIIVLDLGRVIPSGRRGSDLLILPDFDSSDSRLGFEEFAYPLEQLLVVALVSYVICYLVRLEGAYMASTHASSLAEFVRDDILSGIALAANTRKPQDLQHALVGLIDLGEQQIRGVLAWLMAVFVTMFSLATVLITVRGAALSARMNALRGLQDGTMGLTGKQQAAAAKKVKAMVIWPLGYVKLDVLIFWIVMAVVTLVLYRIGLFVAGIVLFVLFVRLIKRLALPTRDRTPKPPARPRG